MLVGTKEKNKVPQVIVYEISPQLTLNRATLYHEA